MDIENWYAKLLARYRNADIDRRTFLQTLGLAGASLGAVSLANPLGPRQALADTQKLRVDGHGTSAQAQWNLDIFPKFIEETGIEIEQGSFTGLGAFLSQVQIAPEGFYNAFPAPEPRVAMEFSDYDLLEEIDESQIPRLSTVIPRAVDLYRSISPTDSILTVPYYLTGNSIVYNTDVISSEEMEQKGFDILLDPTYAGRISGEDDWASRIWYAAIQAGQDPNGIEDMSAVWDKVRESRGIVLKYWASSAEGTALLTTGETVVQDFRFSALLALESGGLPFAGWPRQGTSVGVGSFGALKGTPMEAFYHFIDILLRPEVQFPLTLATAAMTLLDPTQIEFPEEIKAMPGYDPTGTMEGYPVADARYWTDNALDWQREYTRVMAGG